MECYGYISDLLLYSRDRVQVSNIFSCGHVMALLPFWVLTATYNEILGNDVFVKLPILCEGPKYCRVLTLNL